MIYLPTGIQSKLQRIKTLTAFWKKMAINDNEITPIEMPDDFASYFKSEISKIVTESSVSKNCLEWY